MTMLRNILANKPILKINSCILGCCFWYLFSQFRPIKITFSAPLTFYENDQDVIEAPETIKVCLQGYKKDFYALDLQSLAIHINCNELHEGKNYLNINHKNLFLPSSIKLLHYIPSNVVALVKKIK